MQDTLPMHVIATMHSAFPAKFGIPRQSGLVAVSYTHLTLPTTSRV